MRVGARATFGANILEDVSSGRCVTKRARRTKRRPFRISRKRKLEHPAFSQFLKAGGDSDDETTGSLMDALAGIGGRRFLAKVASPDTCAFFSYLAKETGRQARTSRFAYAALPLTEVVDPRGKYSCLADFFADKLTDPLPWPPQG